MESAKEKVKDMASAAKEKAKEYTAKAQGKGGEAIARNHHEKEMAKEHAKAKEAQAKADFHEEKAEHREDSAAHHGATRVHLNRNPHGYRNVGAYPPATLDRPPA